MASSAWLEPGARFPQMQEEHRRYLHFLQRQYGSRFLICQLKMMDYTAGRGSIMSTSTYSSTQSLTSNPFGTSDGSVYQSDAASINDSLYSQSSYPESTTDASVYMASETASLNGHELHDSVPFSPVPTPHLESAVAAATPAVDMPPSPASVTGKPIHCPLCAVYRIYIGFTRKSDFKKHLHQFHNTNCLWICRHDKCGMVFDFEKAYSNHVKDEHGDPQTGGNGMGGLAADIRAKVQLCPQVVFACGFVRCKDKVFEADADEGAPATALAYFEHVAGHFDKKAQASSAAPAWEYRVQMQNLLRQRSLKELWKNSMWSKEARNALAWQPRSSCDLKKVLECRHLGGSGVSELFHRAWTLGSTTYQLPNQSPPNFAWEASRPIRGRCPMAPGGHNEFSISHQKKPQPQAVFRSGGSAGSSFAKAAAARSHILASPVPEEPMNWDLPAGDIVGGPHPGTLMPIPEDDHTVGWEDPDPFDPFPGANTPAEHHHHPHHAHHAMTNHTNGAAAGPQPSPIAPWSNMPHATFGAMAPLPPLPPTPNDISSNSNVNGSGALPPPPSSRPKTPVKRRISIGRKSFENLRKKGRNTSPPSERLPDGFPPGLVAAFSASSSSMDFELPLRSHGNGGMSTPPVTIDPSAGFFFGDRPV